MHSARVILASALALGLAMALATFAWAAPVLSIDDGPSDPTNVTTPQFTFSFDASATSVECSIVPDQATPAYGACSGATTHQPDRSLDDGDYVFWVRASDGVDPPVERQWPFTVDTTGPALSIGAGQAGPTNVTTPSFLFTLSDGTADCSVDGGLPVSCTSPFTVGAPLSEGRHTLLVQARDALGNPSEDSLDFTIDTTPPALSIGAGQAGPTNDNTPQFAFTVSGASAVQCWVDQATPVSCTSPYTVGTSLSDGTHTLFVHASDRAGNVSDDSLDFTVDTVRPAVMWTSGPTATNLATPSFGFTAEARARTECWVDGGTPVTCASPFTVGSPLSDGRHTFHVRATDAAGNRDEDLHAFTVDSDLPSLSIDSGPEGPTNATTPSFGFTAEPGASAECAITPDPGVPVYGSCSGLATHAPATPLQEGSYIFWVRATDSADNRAISQRSFTVDTTPPALSIAFGPSGTTSDTTPLFGFTAEADATVQCSIDQGTEAYGPCASATTHAAAAPLADGAYVFRVRATDRAGNQTTATRGFTVDTVPDPPTPDPTPPAAPRLLSPFPLVRISGTLTANGARIRLLSVRGPRGALVQVTVRPGCGGKRRASRRCRVLRASGTVGRRAVIAFRRLERAYRSGTVIVVLVSRPDRIGKYTRFTIVRGKAPRRVDQCLMPGATRGSRCPSA